MIAGVVLGPSLLGADLARGRSRSCFRRNRSPCSTPWRNSESCFTCFSSVLSFRSDELRAARHRPRSPCRGGHRGAVHRRNRRYAVAAGNSRAVRAGRHRASTPRCSSARPSPSRPSPCSRASFTSAASQAHPRPRCACRRPRSATPSPGAWWRWCSRVSAPVPSVAVLAIAGGTCLALVLVLLGPRLFAPLGRLAERDDVRGRPLSPTVLAVVADAAARSRLSCPSSSVCTPCSAPSCRAPPCRAACSPNACAQLLEPVTLVFLLPVFFTYSGLQHASHAGRYAALLRGSRSASCSPRFSRSSWRAGPRRVSRDWSSAPRSRSARS